MLHEPAFDIKRAFGDERRCLELAVEDLEELRLVHLAAGHDAAVIRFGHHVHGGDVDAELPGCSDGFVRRVAPVHADAELLE